MPDRGVNKIVPEHQKGFVTPAADREQEVWKTNGTPHVGDDSEDKKLSAAKIIIYYFIIITHYSYPTLISEMLKNSDISQISHQTLAP